MVAAQLEVLTLRGLAECVEVGQRRHSGNGGSREEFTSVHEYLVEDRQNVRTTRLQSPGTAHARQEEVGVRDPRSPQSSRADAAIMLIPTEIKPAVTRASCQLRAG